MKNLKNMVAALSLMAVMGLGAVSANAGLLITDRSQNPCSEQSGGLVNDIQDVIAAGASMLDGIIIIGRNGLIITDRQPSCTGRDGLIITD